MRIATRALSALLALALLAGGVVVALEIASAALGREQPLVLPWDEWYQHGIDTTWTSTGWRVVFVALVAAGLALLVVLLARRPPTSLALEHRVDGADAEVDRVGLERWLSSRLQDVDGVSGAKIKVRGHKARVKAVTPGRQTGPVRESLGTAARQALDDLDLARPLPVRVAVSSQRES